MWVSVCVFISMHFATCVQWTLNIHFHCAIKQYKIILQMIIFSRPSCTHTHEHLDIPGALDCKSGIINANNILAACIHHKMGHANKTITNEMKWLYYRTIYKVGIPWCVCVYHAKIALQFWKMNRWLGECDTEKRNCGVRSCVGGLLSSNTISANECNELSRAMNTWSHPSLYLNRKCIWKNRVFIHWKTDLVHGWKLW